MSSDLPKSSIEEVSPNKIHTLDVDMYAVGMTFNPQEDQLAVIAAEKPLEGYIGHHSGTVHATHHLFTCSVTGSNINKIPVSGLDLASNLSVIDGNYYWTQSASYYHDVYITMNAPVEFDSPTNGHSYRLFQESFSGPWKPGDPEYERVIPADSQQEDLYLSVLTVNRDPGRAIRNLGCLIVCLGIAIMFYMKAYFFKPRRKKAAGVPADETNDTATNTPEEAPSDES